MVKLLPLNLVLRAVDAIKARDKERAILLLSRAIFRLQLPLQRLPKWVTKGATIGLEGEDTSNCYEIVSVSRGGRGAPWFFRCVKKVEGEVTKTFSIHQERGRRKWRKHGNPRERS
jgi:hypothetical protein